MAGHGSHNSRLHDSGSTHVKKEGVNDRDTGGSCQGGYALAHDEGGVLALGMLRR
jgi:hypothetical protein